MADTDLPNGYGAIRRPRKSARLARSHRRSGFSRTPGPTVQRLALTSWRTTHPRSTAQEMVAADFPIPCRTRHCIG